MAGAAKLAGGALADDPARRRATAIGGYSATAVLNALIGVATAAWQVGVLRTGAWLTRGLRTPSRNALLTDLVSPQVYGRAYGFERAMDNLGAIVGPLLALALVALVGVRDAILLSFIPGFLAAAAIFVAIKAAPRLEKHERPPLRLRIRPVLRGELGRLLAGRLRVRARQRGRDAADPARHRPAHAEPRARLGREGGARSSMRSTTSPRRSRASPPAARPTGVAAIVVLLAGVLAFLVAYVGFAFTGSAIVLLAALFAAAGIGIGFAETASTPPSPRSPHRTCAALPSARSRRFRASATSPPPRSPAVSGRLCLPAPPSSTWRPGWPSAPRLWC